MADDEDKKSGAAPDGPKRTFSLEAARNVALLVAIYLYFAGFVYRDFFAGTFGIPAATDTPVYTYMIYAYNAVAPNLWWFGALVLALFCYDTYAVILTAKQTRTSLERLVVSTEPGLFAFVAVLLFPVLFYSAQAAALADATAIRCGVLPAVTRVVPSFKPGRAASYDSDFIASIPLGPVYLLARTSDSYYVLYQPATPRPTTVQGPATPPPASNRPGCGFLSAARTYQIPSGDVDHVMTIAPTVYR
jgi:hypothetical protein